MNQYPTVKPAIYVWEYDQGQYVDINAQELYPAASIIKIPVLLATRNKVKLLKNTPQQVPHLKLNIRIMPTKQQQ